MLQSDQNKQRKLYVKTTMQVKLAGDDKYNMFRSFTEFSEVQSVTQHWVL